jgi:RNA polymerase sigma factor (sigma-70 family)
LYIGNAMKHPSLEHGLTDGTLLDRFRKDKDEGAFSELFRRHAPLVLGVCERVLGKGLDADDAFQATFIILAEKGKGLKEGSSLGAWLHRVAFRVAVEAAASAERRRRIEMEGATSMRGVQKGNDLEEVLPLVDKELSCLPDQYRQALVLCYLEGKSHVQASSELGRPSGTLSCLLEKGRDLLRDRLVRRGVQVTGAGLAALLAGTGTSHAGAVSPALATLTVQAAMQAACHPGAVPTGAALAKVTALAKSAMAAESGTRGALVATFSGGMAAMGKSVSLATATLASAVLLFLGTAAGLAVEGLRIHGNQERGPAAGTQGKSSGINAQEQARRDPLRGNGGEGNPRRGVESQRADLETKLSRFREAFLDQQRQKETAEKRIQEKNPDRKAAGEELMQVYAVWRANIGKLLHRTWKELHESLLACPEALAVFLVAPENEAIVGEAVRLLWGTMSYSGSDVSGTLALSELPGAIREVLENLLARGSSRQKLELLQELEIAGWGKLENSLRRSCRELLSDNDLNVSKTALRMVPLDSLLGDLEFVGNLYRRLRPEAQVDLLGKLSGARDPQMAEFLLGKAWGLWSAPGAAKESENGRLACSLLEAVSGTKDDRIRTFYYGCLEEGIRTRKFGISPLAYLTHYHPRYISDEIGIRPDAKDEGGTASVLLAGFDAAAEEGQGEQESLFQELGKQCLDLPLAKAVEVLEQARLRTPGSLQARIASVLDRIRSGETRPKVLGALFLAPEEEK